MKYLLVVLTILSTHATAMGQDAASNGSLASDWPLWRGPQQTGIAARQPATPTSWSNDKQIAWKTKVPGKGHGSPIVFGNRVYLLSADESRSCQVLLAYNRSSGKLVWETKIHEGNCLKVKGRLNSKATMASTTPACDGQRLYVNLLNGKDAFTSAVDFNGKVLWQTKLSSYVVHQGYGASPLIYKNLVIASADNKSGGAIVAMNRQTGEEVWRRARPKKPNYASPIVVSAAGKDQLVVTGCNLVTSLNPLTGEELWEVKGATTECVTSTVSDGRVVLTSGGYPTNHMSAVLADGSGKVAWENKNRVYVPSVVLVKGHIFAMLDAGIAVCIEMASGEEKWKKRIGGTFSSSLVCAGDMIYATDESGKTTIFKADTAKYVEVAENSLGDIAFASPAICGGKIYTRRGFNEGSKRQEYLICIAP